MDACCLLLLPFMGFATAAPAVRTHLPCAPFCALLPHRLPARTHRASACPILLFTQHCWCALPRSFTHPELPACLRGSRTLVSAAVIPRTCGSAMRHRLFPGSIAFLPHTRNTHCLPLRFYLLPDYSHAIPTTAIPRRFGSWPPAHLRALLRFGLRAPSWLPAGTTVVLLTCLPAGYTDRCTFVSPFLHCRRAHTHAHRTVLRCLPAAFHKFCVAYLPPLFCAAAFETLTLTFLLLQFAFWFTAARTRSLPAGSAACIYTTPLRTLPFRFPRNCAYATVYHASYSFFALRFCHALPLPRTPVCYASCYTYHSSSPPPLPAIPSRTTNVLLFSPGFHTYLFYYSCTPHYYTTCTLFFFLYHVHYTYLLFFPPLLYCRATTTYLWIFAHHRHTPCWLHCFRYAHHCCRYRTGLLFYRTLRSCLPFVYRTCRACCTTTTIPFGATTATCDLFLPLRWCVSHVRNCGRHYRFTTIPHTCHGFFLRIYHLHRCNLHHRHTRSLHRYAGYTYLIPFWFVYLFWFAATFTHVLHILRYYHHCRSVLLSPTTIGYHHFCSVHCCVCSRTPT